MWKITVIRPGKKCSSLKKKKKETERYVHNGIVKCSGRCGESVKQGQDQNLNQLHMHMI